MMQRYCSMQHDATCISVPAIPRRNAWGTGFPVERVYRGEWGGGGGGGMTVVYSHTGQRELCPGILAMSDLEVHHGCCPCVYVHVFCLPCSRQLSVAAMAMVTVGPMGLTPMQL